MPIYEYQCAACGEVFDRLQKLSDPDPTACPACGKAEVKRKLSAPSFRLAGSGWYETDFKGDKDKRRNLAGGDDAPPAAKPAETASPGKGDPAPASGASTPAKPATDAAGAGSGAKSGSGAGSGSGAAAGGGSGSGPGSASGSASGSGSTPGASSKEAS